MLVIADNITARKPELDRLFRQLMAPAGHAEAVRRLQELARKCLAAGTDAIEINLQQHHDRPEVMAAAVDAIQQVTDRQICLSTNNAETLKAGVAACRRFPIINYISLDEARLREMLPVAAKGGAEVVLLASDPVAPADAREMLGKAAVLVGAASEVGIPRDRVFLDPGLIHITHDVGQRHLAEVREFLRSLPEVFDDPPVRTTCWLGNISSGAPGRLRPAIETALLAVLATLGLSSVFMDVLRPENLRMLRLTRILNNEAIYSNGDIELRSV